MTLQINQMYAGKVQPLGARAAPSAIAKSSLAGPWTITETGLMGDAQGDLVNHGGPEKALHHYPRDHYAVWAAEAPELAPKLAAAPAFGENISLTGLTEADIHIGDIYRVGSVLLQVSQGRQPCWKLNERFGFKDMARRVQTTGRTGWYYRVLEPGTISPGDALHLVERPQPDWPLTRLIELLYRRTLAYDELAVVAELPQLAANWRAMAQRRIANRAVESWDRRLEGAG